MTFLQMLNQETKQFMWNSQMADPKADIEKLIESNKQQIFRRTVIHYCTQFGAQAAIDMKLTFYFYGRKYGVNKFDINHILFHQIGNQSHLKLIRRTWKDYLRYFTITAIFVIVFAIGYLCGVYR